MPKSNIGHHQMMDIQIVTILPVELFHEETVQSVRNHLSNISGSSRERTRRDKISVTKNLSSQHITEQVKKFSVSEFEIWQLGEDLDKSEIADLSRVSNALTPVGGEKLLALQTRGEGRCGTSVALVLISRFAFETGSFDEKGRIEKMKFSDTVKELNDLRKDINDKQYKLSESNDSAFLELIKLFQEVSVVDTSIIAPNYAFSFVSINYFEDNNRSEFLENLVSTVFPEDDKPLSVKSFEERDDETTSEEEMVWLLHCDWSTLLQVCNFESSDMYFEEFNRLVAMEIVLQAYWNRCAALAFLLDIELRSTLDIPNKEEFYLELHRTPDDANHLISSMASQSNITILNKLFETSRVAHETNKFKGMRESLLARDTRQLSQEQHYSQIRTEALSIIVLLVAVGSIVINAIEGLREFDEFSIISLAIAVTLFWTVWYFMNFISNPHKAEKGLILARWFRKIIKRK